MFKKIIFPLILISTLVYVTHPESLKGKPVIKVGDHITLDFVGVKNAEKLYTPQFYKTIITEIAEAAGVEIASIQDYKFEPQGYTILALLKESHMSFHTFPELGFISFDFFTCGKIHPKIALEILKKAINHERVIYKNIVRNDVELYNDPTALTGVSRFYHAENKPVTTVTKMGQHIEIMKLQEFGNALFIDGELQVAQNDERIYSKTFVELSLKSSADKKAAAVLGGGDGGVVRECLSNNFEKIDWFELDEEVVAACKTYLPKVFQDVDENSHVNCCWGDAFQSIKQVPDQSYDKIFVDLNNDDHCINLAQSNMDQIKRVLKKGGVITVQVGNPETETDQIRKWYSVLKENFDNTQEEAVYIPSFDGRWSFLSAQLN